MKYLKTYESYWTEQEYISDVVSGLSKYNVSPVELKKLIGAYEKDILACRDAGKNPKEFTDKIVKDLELEQGGFGTPMMGVIVGRNRSNFALSV